MRTQNNKVVIIDTKVLEDLKQKKPNYQLLNKILNSYSSEFKNFLSHIDSLLKVDTPNKYRNLELSADDLEVLANYSYNSVHGQNINENERSEFSKLIFQVIEKTNLNLSDAETKVIAKTIPIVDKYRSQGNFERNRLHWDDKHQQGKIAGQHMSQKSIKKLKQDLSPNKQAIEFQDQGRTHYLELSFVGSIGVIYLIKNKDHDVIKAVRLVSGFDQNGRTVNDYSQQYRDFQKVSEYDTSQAHASAGDLVTIESSKVNAPQNMRENSAALIMPMSYINSSYKTLEQSLPNIEAIINDSNPLDKETIKQVLDLYLKVARSIQAAHKLGYAQVNVKNDGYILRPDKDIATKINTSLFTSANAKFQDERFVGTYALRDTSANALQGEDQAILQTDIHSLGVMLAQTILGKDMWLYGNIAPAKVKGDNSLLAQFIEEQEAKFKLGISERDKNILAKKYLWDGQTEDGVGLRGKLQQRLTNLDPKKQTKLINLIMDIVVLKDHGLNGSGQQQRSLFMRQDLSKDLVDKNPLGKLRIDKVVETLRSLL